MTRINIIPVEKISNKQLMAEYLNQFVFLVMF